MNAILISLFQCLRSLDRASSILGLFRQLGGLAALLAVLLGSAPSTGAADTVAISEVVSRNSGGLADEDNETPDWIELFNSGSSSMNLLGWYLTDDPADLHKWAFPATALPAQSFLIVFASGKDRATNGAPLHTNFSLDQDGEYLALVHESTIVTEFAPKLPPTGRANYSYGTSQTVMTNVFIAAGATAKVFIPNNGSLGLDWTTNGFDDSGWIPAANGIGFEGVVSGWAVRYFKANIIVDTLAKADGVVTNPAQQSLVASGNYPVINFFGTGSEAHYVNNYSFPTQLPGQDVEDFVVEATGIVTIPAAGAWSFGVNSDDGFRLDVGINSVSFPAPRGPSDTLATFTFATAGEYPIRLVYYERGGGSGVEVFAVQGASATWNSTFLLVGDTLPGSLAVKSQGSDYRGLIHTDVGSVMQSNNATAFLRIPFSVVNSASVTQLTLRMRYDDGFVAYLNGQEVARRNAPASPAWNSTATTFRSNQLALVAEQINISDHLNALVNGNNVLAIHGLNDTANGVDFFIEAGLVEHRFMAGTNTFFAAPTPGFYNVGTGVAGFVGNIRTSSDRGFYDGPFSLTLTTATAGATIRYTLNGSAPSLANGFTYVTPLLITNTTTLRSVAFLDGLIPSEIDCQTYLLLDDVIRQSPTGAAPTPEWPPPRTSGGQVYDYGMDPDIVNNATWGPLMKDGLKSLPSFSIVMKLGDLFDPVSGIYANPSGDEIAWERPGSLELIYPDGSQGFQINCGIRIRGGFSRDPNNPKHAFRFFFRQQYGESKLNYPLFGNAGADKFDKIDIRTMQNYSWAYQNDPKMICVRDTSSRDAQRAMGQPSERGDFCHLYLNGQYWGLYNVDERPEASYGETYFGGRAEDYDTIKVDPDIGYNIEPTDGYFDAWLRLWQAATNGFTSNADYFRVQGLNPDGTPNPAYEILLDVDNLIDYMLIILYGGNLDAPISNFLGNDSPNNWFGLRHRGGLSGGFKYFAHDSEHTLLNVSEDRTGLVDNQIGTINPDWTAGNPVTGSSFSKSSPQYLWFRLVQNAEFRLRAADRIQKYCFNGGLLTPQGMRANLLTRSNEIYRAMVCESARWGDAKRTTPFNRNDWVAAMNTVFSAFIPNRTTVLVNQLRADGFYPQVAAPLFAQYGGFVSNGFALFLTNSTPNSLLYYTTDGTDPRLLGGALGGSALAYTPGTPVLIGSTITIRARTLSNTVWSAIVEATFYPIQNLAGLQVTEIMYNPPARSGSPGEDFEFLEMKNNGNEVLDLSGFRFSEGIEFTFTNGTQLSPGQFFVLGRNAAQLSTNKYPGLAVNGVYRGKLDNNGEEITLEHPLIGPILSFRYNDGGRWPIAADGQGFSLVPRNPNSNASPGDPRSWRGSTNPGGSPGADDPAPVVPSIQITEILTHTIPPDVDRIELYNPTPNPVNLKGWWLTDNSNLPFKYRFNTDTIIGGNGFLVLSEADFNATPGTNNSFALEGGGEEVYLLSGDPGSTNLTGYSDGFAFDAAPEGVTIGRYITSTGDDHYVLLATNTLGGPNSGPFVGPVVIRQVMYHPPDFAGGYDNTSDEYIELVNRSSSPVPLFDPMAPTNVWHLRGGVSLDFGSGVTLGPGGNAVLVSFSPDNQSLAGAFRSKFGHFATTLLFGPYSGKLDNSSDAVEIKRPDTPGTNGTPYYTIDRVEYHDTSPWPTNADGGGGALTRIALSEYGNDPTNWTGMVPLQIVLQPISRNVRTKPDPFAGANPTTNFSVQAVSALPIAYQWRFKGTNISSGLNPTAVTTNLILTNLSIADGGDYDSAVSDASGTIYSAKATLTPLVQPVYVQRPLSQTNAVGAPFEVSAVISGSPEQFLYLWKSNSPVIGAIFSSATTNYFTITSVLAVAATRYQLVVSNLASIGPGTQVAFTNYTVADFDGDGLPDYYEALLGLNTNDVSDAAGDLDGDGMSNLAEYLAGTDANDSNSFLRVEQTVFPGLAIVQLSAVSNRTYTVQFTDKLPAVSWTRLADVVARPTNHIESFPDPTWTTNRFYRVVLPRQP
jgi:hypothetical protein